MAKGSQFERDIARQLSLWWSGGKHDDLLWRSTTSGARATTRAKKGKRTAGHSGDLAPTCSDGESLTRIMTFELKRGYRNATVGQMLDNPGGAAVPLLDQFMRQAQLSSMNARTPFWGLIHKRDRCVPLIYFSYRLWKRVEEVLRFNPADDEPFRTVAVCQTRQDKHHKGLVTRFCAMRLSEWTDLVTPRVLKKAARAS